MWSPIIEGGVGGGCVYQRYHYLPERSVYVAPRSVVGAASGLYDMYDIYIYILCQSVLLLSHLIHLHLIILT